MDLLLTNDRDLDLTTGDMQLLDGALAIKQNLDIRFDFFLGEYFLDRNLGVPWYQKILGKQSTKPVIDNIFKKVILTTAGILELIDYNSIYDGAHRSLTVSFKARVTGSDELLVYTKEVI